MIVAAIVLSGGVALAVLAIGGALLMADTLMAYSEGEIGTEGLLAAVVLGVIPGGKLAGVAGKGVSAASAAISAGTQSVSAAVRTSSVAARLTNVASRVQVVDGVTEIAIRMKKGWTEDQVAAMVNKITQVNESDPVVTYVRPGARTPSPVRMWDGARQARRAGFDIGHILDLRLGGRNVLENLQLLDRSVNRSFGAQIKTSSGTARSNSVHQLGQRYSNDCESN